ncbi:general secretion pathway protein GspF [Hahella sp. HN01]|uniref:general secretion pathway protein GspF n=1 Tax=Hahella sp. HN01 TaxID=2847262 RepID=UPI001C1E9A4C|nr:general secretion pathway protein GspF [Hahella sp. HN01]MBU6950485.1 general secretion pathway protein GspF [Hahella sp. HN01]
MARRRGPYGLDEPLFHPDHKRPVTRRDFIAQGFMAGTASVFGTSVLGLFANPRQANAALSSDLESLKASCGIAVQGAGKIPFICFDLAGGANISGSNVLVGQQGGQMDFLSTAGYSKLGLPGNMTPAISGFVNQELGLAFHSDSAFLRGILEKTQASTRAFIDGAVIPARSDNDTGNNPHNPMYGIYNAGADGSLVSLIGSSSSDSGGNSMAPAMLMNPKVRPTKVDRPSDVTGLVDVGDLVGLLDQSDAVAVMEAIYRISDKKTGVVTTDEVVKKLVDCGYLKSADLADRFGNPASLNPALDTDIVGPSGIFTQAEFDSDGEFRKTASVMKMVLNGYAGAGTITMGGFDYHTGDRATGERRDLRAGRCMGACLEYAARLGMPLMMYVFSDGSLASNGRIDDSVDGRGKGEWTGDNSSTAASFFLVFNPGVRPKLKNSSANVRQIGYMRADASVETASSPAANNVNLLVNTVVLNYMALHNEQGNFATTKGFEQHGLGADLDKLIPFEMIVNGKIG